MLTTVVYIRASYLASPPPIHIYICIRFEHDYLIRINYLCSVTSQVCTLSYPNQTFGIGPIQKAKHQRLLYIGEKKKEPFVFLLLSLP